VNKKLIFKFKYFQEELNEIKEQEKGYDKEFSIDFAKEIEYIGLFAPTHTDNSANTSKKECSPAKPTNELEETVDIKNPKVFKEIYKNLVKKLHPDKQEEKYKIICEEKLKEITELYKDKKWINLIAYAHEENINIPYVPIEYSKKLENEIKDIEKDIARIKTKVSWVWSTQIKPNKQLREILYPSMKIEQKKFEQWKKKI